MNCHTGTPSVAVAIVTLFIVLEIVAASEDAAAKISEAALILEVTVNEAELENEEDTQGGKPTTLHL